mgnify:CR=1 FL=1
MWKWDSWFGNGSRDMERAEADDRGTMIQTTLNTDQAIVYFQAPVTYDLSDWVDGSVEFDMRLVEKGKAPGFRVRVDCVPPCSSGDSRSTSPISASGSATLCRSAISCPTRVRVWT